MKTRDCKSLKQKSTQNNSAHKPLTDANPDKCSEYYYCVCSGTALTGVPLTGSGSGL